MTTDASLHQAADLGHLAVHSITTKPLRLDEAVREYASRGIRGISVWQDALEPFDLPTARRMIMDHGLSVPALVRGGFFCADTKASREDRIDENRRLIEIASEVDAEMLVLVVGAIPKEDLNVQRSWVSDGIAALVEDATASGVRLAIEPLHPMYAADKSCVNRIAEANEICQRIDDPLVGVAVDVYHVWWDPELQSQIQRLGQANRLFAFHLCDWRVPTRDFLNDRAVMGDGCIDIPTIRSWVESAGFNGWNEVEIFSTELWSQDQRPYLDRIVDSYLRLS
ncbi:MAG: sugar phosphate isomerase/epimerase family protein [Planctomycetota bacterium]